MRRRTAIQTLAAFGSLAATPCLSRATTLQEKPAGSEVPWIRKCLKIGMIGVKGSLEYKFRVAKAAGFDGVEFNAPGVNVAELKAASKASGLMIDGSVGGTPLASSAQRSRSSRAGKSTRQSQTELGRNSSTGWRFVLAGCRAWQRRHSQGSRRTVDRQHQARTANRRKNYRSRSWLKTSGTISCTIPLAIAINPAQPLAEYIDAFDSPWVGLQFDLGNHWKFGDIAQWIRTLGPRIKKLDIKGFSRATNKFTKITEGDVDWPAIEKALRDIGFKGWCAAEVGGGNVKRLKEIADNMETALHCSKNVVA